ncbi:MAG: hypothetical protein ABW217_12130 [Polyangiaceae bacterium]
MAMAVVFIGWNQPHPGQERESRAYLEGPGLASLHALQGRGFERLERLSGAVTGALAGGALLYGERDQLEALRRSQTFTRFERAMSRCFEGFAVVTGTEERLGPSPSRAAPRGVVRRPAA